MKNFVLGALLVAAASSAACTSASTEAVVTANWSFSTFQNRNLPPGDPCPSGFSTASVHAKEWDPVLGQFVPGGLEVIDKFNCSDMSGVTDPLDGVFLIWVSIEDTSGANVYAESESYFFDTASGNANIELPTLFKDAGYFDLSWDLIDPATNARLSCAAAGIGPNGSVETIATAVGSTFMLTDKFTCEDGFGVTDVLPVGTYTVSVDAEDGTGAVGTADTLTNKQITAPNGLTHLGHVRIPITQ